MINASNQIRRRWPQSWPLQPVPKATWTAQQPTYGDAKPGIIDAALKRALRKPTGNWFAFASSTDVRQDQPLAVQVAGIELVAWRDTTKRLIVGPGSCPHLGADLSTGVVSGGRLFCRWHGLALDANSCAFGWKTLPSYDDGVLVWVRLDAIGGENPTESPVIPTRPVGPTLHAVSRAIGVCEPRDIIANRLDPWHGAWFHPYSFTRLDVMSTPSESDDRFVVSVTFRIGPVGVPTIAEFHCPDARTIVMRIIDGEGTGSVVETHATPLGPGPEGRARVMVLEAIVAHSPRPGFRAALRAAPLIARLMRGAGDRLWRDDLIYAQRRYRLREGL